MEPKRLVMIPGPTPVVRSIQDQMGREVAAFGDPDFVVDFADLLRDLKEILRASGEIFVVAGTGTLAMEMAIANTTRRGDRVLIVSHGFFGDRFIEICERRGLEVEVLRAEWGQVVPAEAIDAKLSEKHFAAVTVTHVDTSTGAAAPVEEIGKIMHKYPETMYIVDGVCATAGEREYFDDWNIDILFTGTQKAFGVAPGLCMLWASQKAIERRRSLGIISEYYIDFEKWLPIMHDTAKYFATPAINLIWALKQSVDIIKREGVENRYNRHQKNARAIQAAMEHIGLVPLAHSDCRAVTLSNLLYPEGVNDAEFRAEMLRQGAIVAGGLGNFAGKMFRLGHMGNTDTHELVAAIAAIERSLAIAGKRGAQLGEAVGIFQRALCEKG